MVSVMVTKILVYVHGNEPSSYVRYHHRFSVTVVVTKGICPLKAIVRASAAFSTMEALLMLLVLALVLPQQGSAKICTNAIADGVSHTLRSRFMHATANESSNYNNHVQHSSLIASLEDKEKQSRRSMKEHGSRSFLEPVSLHQVSLAANSPQGVAQQTNLEYLLLLEVDSLVYSFRTTAGLSAPGSPYGGWEAPSSELRGHFVGHYLSAAALMWASTHNETLREKMTALVDALAECQAKMSTGYLSAFPSSFFDRFEALEPVWAPYYTVHKIMAGLLDQYMFAENEKALNMALNMTSYFYNRVRSVIQEHTIERHWESLNEETGGMNDVLYRIYTITRNPDHLELAHLFDKPCFLGLLAVQSDSLSGNLYRDISKYFMEVINSSHVYATGGTSSDEFWSDPNRLVSTLGTENAESCATYNMLKVAQNLFRWTKEMPYIDYYERAVTNAILSIQRGQEPGVMLYMTPLAPGSSKAHSYHGWGTKYSSFWCCYGTGIETFSKLGDSIYFEESGKIPSLYIVQFVSSTVHWKASGLTLQQVVQPLTSYDPKLRVTIKCSEASTSVASLYIRVPYWAAAGSTAILNGASVSLPKPGSFLRIQRKWKVSDTLSLVFTTAIRIEKISDDRQEYQAVNAIFFGPYLLAGVSDGDWNMGSVNISAPSDWLVPVHPSFSARLYNFRQHQQVLTHENGRILMTNEPANGTSEAFHSTFRISTPVVGEANSAASSTAGELAFMVVSLELMSRPGSFLSHNGSKKQVSLVEHRRVKNVPSSLAAVFQVLPGISGDKSAVSFEAAGMPGCYLYVDKTTSAVELRCKPDGGDDFEACSSFFVSHSTTTYDPISFVAHGTGRSYLLFPLNAYKDEHYTVYFDMK